MRYGKHPNPGVPCLCYKHNSRQAIYCTPLPGAASDATTFALDEDRKRFMKKHCYARDPSERCAKYPVLLRYCGIDSDG